MFQKTRSFRWCSDGTESQNTPAYVYIVLKHSLVYMDILSVYSFTQYPGMVLAPGGRMICLEQIEVRVIGSFETLNSAQELRHTVKMQ